MSHDQVRELLDAYVDRELDIVTALALDRHLSECDACRATFARYEQLHSSVKAQIPRFKAPERLESKIRAQLRSAERNQHNRTPQRARFLNWRAWAIAAGVGIVVAFGVLLLLQIAKRPSASQELAEQVVSSHIRSLMANHLADVPSTDQHTVKPWFNGKLDFAPVVKDLSPEGFPLIGGRLDYLNNRPVAALVYRHRQHPINLFVWPSTNSDAALRTTTIKGYNLVHWTQEHATYWAVSDLNAAELKDFADELQK
jgi:anti-sigma factor RsiW